MNTEERIKQTLKEYQDNKLNSEILKLELESLVIQAQLEQLEKEKE